MDQRLTSAMGAHAQLFEAWKTAATDYVTAQGAAAIAVTLGQMELYARQRRLAETARKQFLHLDHALLADMTEDAAAALQLPLAIDVELPSLLAIE